MSYGGLCRNRLSFGQMGVMLNNIPSFATRSTGYAISGPTSVCTDQNYTYNIPVLAGNSTYSWVTPSMQQSTPVPPLGQGTRTISTAIQSGRTTETIIVQPQCGFPMAEKTVNVLGQLTITGPSQMPRYEIRNYAATYISGSTYQWYVPAGWSIISGQGSSNIMVETGQNAVNGWIDVRSSLCNGSWGSKRVTIGPGGPQRLKSPNTSNTDIYLAPNPANNQLEIVLPNNENYAIIEFVEAATGRILSQINTNSNRQLINVTDLPQGLTIVKTTTHNNVYLSKIIINH
jgi:hypothetical protein